MTSLRKLDQRLLDQRLLDQSLTGMSIGGMSARPRYNSQIMTKFIDTSQPIRNPLAPNILENRRSVTTNIGTQIFNLTCTCRISKGRAGLVGELATTAREKACHRNSWIPTSWIARYGDTRPGAGARGAVRGNNGSGRRRRCNQLLVWGAPRQPVAPSSDIFDGQGGTTHRRARRYVPQGPLSQPAPLAALPGHHANDRSAEYAELSRQVMPCRLI